MTSRRPAALLLVPLVAGLVVVASAAAAPASAAVPAGDGDEVVLSVDGTTWSPDITTPLFDPDLVWVPGDLETGTLYARNDSGEAARASARVELDVAEGAALADRLHVRTRLGEGPWTDGVRSATADLAPGAVLPIGIEVAFDPGATNPTQRQRVGIDVVVALSAANEGVPGPEGPGGPGSGSAGPGGGGRGVLPPTGADLLLPVLVAAGAVALGALLRRRARHD